MMKKLLFVFIFALTVNCCNAEQCQLQHKFSNIAGHKIFYLSAGHGPKILLLHGLFAQKEQWQGIMCALSKRGYQTVAPDLPGFGKSVGYPLKSYAFENQILLLREFTKKISYQHFAIAGSSMGGAIAALYTAKYPSQITSLAFLGSPQGVINWGPKLKQAILKGVNPFIPVTVKQFQLEIKLLFANPPKISPAVAKALVTKYRINNRRYQQIWNIVTLYMQALNHFSTHKPTLIVWGKNDNIFPNTGADKLHQLIPHSKLVKLKNASHLLIINHAQQVAKIYADFLHKGARS